MSLIDRSNLKYDYAWKLAPANKPRSSATTEGETESEFFRSEDETRYCYSLMILPGGKEFLISSGQEDRKISILKTNMTRKEARVWLKENLTKKQV